MWRRKKRRKRRRRRKRGGTEISESPQCWGYKWVPTYLIFYVDPWDLTLDLRLG